MKLLACSAKPGVQRRWLQSLTATYRRATADSFTALRARLQRFPPDLLLLHLNLPGLQGTAGAIELHRRYPGMRILAFADIPTIEQGLQLIKGGINGYLNTYSATDVIAQSADVVNMGEIWVGRDLMQHLISGVGRTVSSHAEHYLLDQLTPREREIAVAIAAGSSNKKIATELGVTERTVKAHLTSIYGKTGVPDRLQLALLLHEPSAAPRKNGTII